MSSPIDVGADARRDQGDAAGAAPEVEKPLARAELEPLDDALVDRREGLGDPLVVRTAPGVGRVAQSAPSIARLVSSVRTFHSSG